MARFAADLHVHTALSPCAADEMTPPAIVQAALERGLAMIAVCDHNAAGNAEATKQAATLRSAGSAKPLAVIAGVEITTAEEAHVVGLFRASAPALATAQEVQATLPRADETYYERFGNQWVVSEAGQVVRREERMLAAASAFDLTAAIGLVHRHGGLAIAAHVNRPSFSVLSQLGVFPEGAGFDAIEVFTPCGTAVLAVGRPGNVDLPVIAASDAHLLADIGRAPTVFEMQVPTFDELVLALRGTGGRGVRRA